jgi:hypothetical protein
VLLQEVRITIDRTKMAARMAMIPLDMSRTPILFLLES